MSQRPVLALVHDDPVELVDWYGGVVAQAAAHGLGVVVVAPASPGVDALASPGVHIVHAPLERGSTARTALAMPVLSGALVERRVTLAHALSTRTATLIEAARPVVRDLRTVVTLDEALPAPAGGRLRRSLGRWRQAALERALGHAERVVVFDAEQGDAVRASGVPVSRIARFDAAMGVDVEQVADPTTPPDAVRARAIARLGLGANVSVVVLWARDGDATVDATRSALTAACPSARIEVVDAATPFGRALDLVRAAAVVVHPAGVTRVATGVLLAGAVGVPVVAARSARTRSLVRPEETGLLVPEEPSALAEGAARVIASPALLATWGDAGRRLARRAWDRDLAQRRLLGIYESVLRGGAPVHVARDGRLVGDGGRRELT